MTLPRRLLIFAVFIALLAGLSTWPVARAADQPQLEQIVLTKDMVARFFATFPKFKALGEKYKPGHKKKNPDDGGPAASISGYLENTASRMEMENLVKAHGFDTIADWLGVARSTAVAYGFVKSGKTPEQLGRQAEQALAAIRGNSRLTAEQKKQMEGMIRQQLGHLKRYEPLPENLLIAREMQDQIAALWTPNRVSLCWCRQALK